jgi:DNA replicative helicase MCM subunit Mcm2 (Cdc46/Mcm family)
MNLGQIMVHHPKKILRLFDKAIEKSQPAIIEFASQSSEIQDTLIKKDKFKARIFNLPVNQDPIKGCLPRACDVNRFMCVRGTVVRTGQPKMLEVRFIHHSLTANVLVEKSLQMYCLSFRI